MQNQSTPVGRIARALDHGLARKAQAIDKLPDQVLSTADGAVEGRITADTIKSTIETKAKDIAEHTSVDAAKRWLKSKIDGVRELASKPPIEQGEILAEEAGDALIPHPVTVATTALTGGLGPGVLHVADELEDAAQVGKRLGKVEQRVAKGVQAAEETGARVVKKAVNLPGWKKVEIDMQHIMERHIPGAPYAAGRTLFPEHMGKNVIERAGPGKGERIEGRTCLCWASPTSQ